VRAEHRTEADRPRDSDRFQGRRVDAENLGLSHIAAHESQHHVGNLADTDYDAGETERRQGTQGGTEHPAGDARQQQFDCEFREAQ